MDIRISIYKMNANNGYIYIRNHLSYDLYDACKLGKANNIPERDSQYATGEIKRGYFDPVFEIFDTKADDVEILLQSKFKELNIYHDAGIEFYNKKIIPLIETCLIEEKINYKKLSKEDIDNLIRKARIKNIIKSPNYTPRDYQIDIIDKADIYFKENNKGVLVLMCGSGKTLISLWISQILGANTIIIGVPNILLLEQWEKVVRELFKNIPILTVCDGVNLGTITEFLNRNKKCVVITTYASSYKISDETKIINFTFDMKILDEFHHLTTTDIKSATEAKSYIRVTEINSIKQLSLTATPKELENADDKCVSNDNVEYFGRIIDERSLLWAINNGIICDYVIQTIIPNENQLNNFGDFDTNDQRLILSAFASLKSIQDGYSHHLLIYANSKNNANKLIEYIGMLSKDYFNLPVYYAAYISEIPKYKRDEIINNFQKSEFGIMTCVYCLGEGWDFPLLDAVVFSENMDSKIRIVQSALRASRKNKENPNKITKIILPILDNDLNDANPDLKKVIEVVRQMGMLDETIIEKIKVSQIDIKKQLEIKKENYTNELGEFNKELTNNLKLKITKRSQFGMTYEEAKKIILNHNITTKEGYRKLCDREHKLNKEPDKIFGGHFKGWIDYLSIDRGKYYNLETCKSKAKEYSYLFDKKLEGLDVLIKAKMLCEKDSLFPPYDIWQEYYGVLYIDIISDFNKKQKITIYK